MIVYKQISKVISYILHLYVFTLEIFPNIYFQFSDISIGVHALDHGSPKKELTSDRKFAANINAKIENKSQVSPDKTPPGICQDDKTTSQHFSNHHNSSEITTGLQMPTTASSNIEQCITNANYPVSCSVEDPNKITTHDLNITTCTASSHVAHSHKKVDCLLEKVLHENISTEKVLSDELFVSFPMPQLPNEANPSALSPTAAFLLSFPVVSTVSNSKPTEVESSYSEGTGLLRLDDKPHQPKDNHNLFESISTILNDLNDVSDGKKK